MATVGLSLPLPWFEPRELWGNLTQRFWAADMAMDLGTANSLVYIRGRGIVLNEPSVVAVDEETGESVAVGSEAKRMFGKTARSVRCVRPMKDGVIADFDVASLMIRSMLFAARPARTLNRPRIVIGVPSGITQVEKRAVIDAALGAGVGKVHLVDEPMAAAVGAGLPIHSPSGCMIVDIGGGTTEVAVLGLNATIYSQSIRVAGDEMDEAIQRAIRREHGITIGIYEAERVKMIIGSALPFDSLRSVTVFGRSVATGMPEQVEISDEFVRKSLSEPIDAIIDSVTMALEHTSPEMAHDIMSQGVHLAGGGSLLKGLPERLQRETGIRFYRASDPLSCVVRGVGIITESFESLESLCIS